MSTKPFRSFSSSILLLLLIIFAGCGPRLPKKPLERTKQVKISYEKIDSELRIELTNLFPCPVRFVINSSKEIPWKMVQLKPQQDTILITPWKDSIPKISFSAEFGDPTLPVKNTSINFPISRNRDIKILQGYNGNFTHNHDISKYAIDFALPVGDTLYAATSGYVLQVMEGYKYGGNDKKWLNFGNQIFYYDPESNRYFLYSHLVQNGSFVTEGDYIEAGQPIGLSGNTGYTTTPHLHFAVLVADELPNGLTSIPFEFLGGHKGEQFTKNSMLPKH